MTPKEQLLQEIERSPEFLIEEVLHFLLFLKFKIQQRVVEKPSPEKSPTVTSDSLLGWMNEISSQIPEEEWAKIPSDLSKNLDDYLYGLQEPENENCIC